MNPQIKALKLTTGIILTMFCLSFQPLQAEVRYDTLAGPLPPILIAKETPYLVINDVEVLDDQIVTIEAGAVILFQNFTGLHVRGKLIARGTEQSPVIFTSEYDKEYNPSTTFIANPFDWNGIYIHSDGFGTYMENCRISYSVYGIVSETKFVRLDPVTFKENGKSDFVIEKEHKRDIIANTPYHYVLSTKDAKVDGVDVKILKDPMAPRRNIFRYSGLVLGLGGIISGIAHATQYKTAKEEWVIFNQKNPSDDTKYTKTSEDYRQAQDNYNQKRGFLIFDFTIAVLGTAGFSWSFTF